MENLRIRDDVEYLDLLAGMADLKSEWVGRLQAVEERDL
jgi:hypothetical protein